MAEIRFPFRLEKLINALAFFSQNGVPDLTKLKAAKLLYFADRDHLLKYGRPILGDVYFCLPLGPIPSVSLNEMNDAIAGPEVSASEGDVKAFLEVLEVRPQVFSPHPVFRAKRPFDEDVFSESEIEVLKGTTERYGKYTAAKLVNLSHEEPAWKKANERRSPEGRSHIPYELFFEGHEEARAVLDVLQAEQADSSDFDRLLTSVHSYR